jgi:hypothetical protein
MWIIVDHRIPQVAKESLSKFGKLLEFESHNIVYDTISGHPDVFLFQADKQLIIAPNTPIEFVKRLTVNKIEYSIGTASLGMNYPETVMYNAVVTDKHLIHNLKATDISILENCRNKIHVHSKQAYTRCNLIALDNINYLTSDKGIERKLKEIDLNVLFVDTVGILLQGSLYGFFGGCCGVFDRKLFIIGNLEYHSAKEEIKRFVKNAGFTIIELYDGPLHDGGGIFFVNP